MCCQLIMKRKHAAFCRSRLFAKRGSSVPKFAAVAASMLYIWCC